MNIKKRYRVVFAIVVLAICVGACLKKPTRTASYYNLQDDMEITLELYHSHPFLAEYDRVLVIASKGEVFESRELPPDTGGYAAANFYRCGPGSYFLDGYITSESIAVAGAKLGDSDCLLSDNYLGTFEGVGSNPWRFCLAQQCPEKKLEMQGG